MRRLADLIARDADRLAEIETWTPASCCVRCARSAASLSGSTTSPGWPTSSKARPSRSTSRTSSSTSGASRMAVVAAIVPWNSLLLLLCWKLALRWPRAARWWSSRATTSASAVDLAALMDEAGFPLGVFNVVTGFAWAGRGAGRAPGHRQGGVHRLRPGARRRGGRVRRREHHRGRPARRWAVFRATGLRRRRPGRGLQRAGRGVRRHRADLHGRYSPGCWSAGGAADALVSMIANVAWAIRLATWRAAETEMGLVATEPQYRKVLVSGGGRHRGRDRRGLRSR